MSTILEALKKSEQERKKNAVPTLSDMVAPQESRHWPLWAVLLGFLLVTLISLVVVLSVWPLDRASPEPLTISNDSIAQQQAQTDDQAILVNVISYSDVPEQRFAMIDGKMYRENEFVRPGLRLDSIESDRVIFNLRGRRIERSP